MSSCSGERVDDIGECETQLRMTTAVSYGLRSHIDLLGPDQDIRDGEVYSQMQGTLLTISKSE